MGTFQPTASLDNLRLRAALLRRIREFFAARDVLEVETPVLGNAGVTDPNLASFTTSYAEDVTLYLQTSPEYAMKRLLAAGSGPIFQIAKAFRNGEAGGRHNPEFTLLEWYRPGFDHLRLIDEVDELVRFVLEGHTVLKETARTSYRDAFEQTLGIDPHQHPTDDLVARCRAVAGIDLSNEPSMSQRDAALDVLLTHRVEASFDRERPTFLTDYPASQAALARTRRLDDACYCIAERFELYLGGTELANGFHELCDATEQRRRFEHDREIRRARGLLNVPVDEHLLAALTEGMPACAGVALGVDRLVLLAAGAERLDEVIAFPIDRA